MQHSILLILLLIATQSAAGCGKLCDIYEISWWKTATETDLITELAVSNLVMERNEFGATALHYAARHGSAKHVKILLEAGANVNALTLNGDTPLIGAAESTKNVEILLKAGANIHAQNRLGDTALFHASYAEDPDNLMMLLAAGSKVNQSNNSGWTPLHYAARMGSPSVVEALLNAGANIDTQSGKYEMTPLLEWTGGWMYPQTLNLLLSAGAEVNAKGLGGDTVLHTLLRFKIYSAPDAEESILTLLRYGANALIPNDEDKTPWDYAQTEQLKGTQAYWALNDARYRQMDD